MKLYAAKLNINDNIYTGENNVNQIKLEYIPNRILSFEQPDNKDRFYTEKGNKKGRTIRWTLANIESSEDKKIIIGDIVKEYSEPKLKLSGAKTKLDAGKNVKQLYFAYYVPTEMILIQSTSDIKYVKGLEILGLLISQNSEKIGMLKLQALSKTVEFEKKMLSIDHVNKIQLDYVTPNDPSTVNEIEDILQTNNAKKGKIELENDKDGIKVKETDGSKNKMFSSFLEIVQRGFGEVSAWIGKNNKKITSKEFPITKNISNEQKITSLILEK